MIELITEQGDYYKFEKDDDGQMWAHYDGGAYELETCDDISFPLKNNSGFIIDDIEGLIEYIDYRSN